jgi:hypothetical protein
LRFQVEEFLCAFFCARTFGVFFGILKVAPKGLLQMSQLSRDANQHLLDFASVQPYRIGAPDKPWEASERAAWLASIVEGGTKRSYTEEVVAKLELVKEGFDVQEYGTVVYAGKSEGDDGFTYPLFAAKSTAWDNNKPSVLVTGGVHGYETSGVQGALLFIQTAAKDFTEHFNILVLPCVSPWGYEHIQRWNADAVDPNRSFQPDQPSARQAAAGPQWESVPLAQEAAALISLVSSLGESPLSLKSPLL